MSIKGIEFIIGKTTHKETPGPDGFPVNSTIHLRKNTINLTESLL